MQEDIQQFKVGQTVLYIMGQTKIKGGYIRCDYETVTIVKISADGRIITITNPYLDLGWRDETIDVEPFQLEPLH